METPTQGSQSQDHNHNKEQYLKDVQKDENDDSLTNDESADTDPNTVPDKPGFERNDD